MKKWLTVGAAVMLVAWIPFLYGELTSEPAERKGRLLPSDDAHDEAIEGEPGKESDQGAAGEGQEEAEPEPAVAEPTAEQPTAEPAAAEPPGEPPTALPAPQAPGEPGATAAEPDKLAEGADQDPEEEAEDEPEPTAPGPSGPVAVLKQAFEGQPRDPLWASDTEGKLRALFGTEDVPAALLTSASCRKAVCRLDLHWSPELATAYLSVHQASTELSGAELAVEPVGAAEEDDAQKVQLYVTRKGYTLADLSR